MQNHSKNYSLPKYFIFIEYIIDKDKNGKVQGVFEGEERSVLKYVSTCRTSKGTLQFFIFIEYNIVSKIANKYL